VTDSLRATRNGNINATSMIRADTWMLHLEMSARRSAGCKGEASKWIKGGTVSVASGCRVDGFDDGEKRSNGLAINTLATAV
jgi:hypothetical protein